LKKFLRYNSEEKRDLAKGLIVQMDSLLCLNYATQQYISKVLEITESHPDSRAQRMIELAPGVVTVACRDSLNGGINSYFDMNRWKVDQAKLEKGGCPGSLHYIFEGKRVGTLQLSGAFSDDYWGDFQDSYRVMREILEPINETTFHDKSQEVDLKGLLNNKISKVY